MVMDAALHLHDWRAPLPLPGGSKRLPIYTQIPAAAAAATGGGFTEEELDSLLFLPSDASGYLMNASPAPLTHSTSADSASPPRDAASVSSSAPAAAGHAAHPDDAEAVSDIDIALGYIDRMLMAEDIDEKFEHYPAHAALREAERPFLEILADNPPSSAASTLDSPDSATNSCTTLSSCTCAAPPVLTPPPVLEFSAADFLQPAQLLYPDLSLSPDSCVVDAAGAWPYDRTEFYQLQTNPVSEPGTLLSQSSSFASSNGSSGLALSEGFDSFLNPDAGLSDFVLQSQQASQFSRGFEEGSRFLPQESKLVIDVDSLPSAASLQHAGVKKEKKFLEVKTEKADAHRGKKHFHVDDLDAEEGRCSKHSSPVMDADHLIREMMDKVLLCNGETCSKGVKELREALQHDVANHSGAANGKGSGHGKGRGKKQPKKEVVDLETLLVHCAQSVASDDRRSATELLRQIRQHSCADGDGDQRLAHCFANGLEARLAGTGSQIYKLYTISRFACTDVLKAYQLYLAACPFKKISHYFANQTILNAVEKAKKVHIVDYGVYYGFQWPCLIQRLANRPGGPPELRITGIDTPQPGFRPAGRIEETGKYLTDYARTFNIPFKYHGIASQYEAVQIEDLNIEKDEVLIVNCMFKFKTLMDESVVADSPRNMVLNTIRKMKPHVFIHGITNGSYNAPFFVSRFREALFNYSAMFDMLEANIPRDNEQRLLIESALFNREAINVISCEGLERMERPETYKQWQSRNQRAGFKQLPLDQGIMKRAREKVKCYNKNFIIDEDNKWLLQGWKGRILFALSTWKPNHRSS
ncbi:scarecrow-like protein 9 [Lolium rigidum]|uniref:scarecrow-like protein 9 n=1 Tax=Lolium rigidum TaxID=89674 RepID=UPI001F5C201E|nr:scarecrow-like protein 9 [Lolium rigidum]